MNLLIGESPPEVQSQPARNRKKRNWNSSSLFTLFTLTGISDSQHFFVVLFPVLLTVGAYVHTGARCPYRCASMLMNRMKPQVARDRLFLHEVFGLSDSHSAHLHTFSF